MQYRAMKKKIGAERDSPRNGTSTSGRTRYAAKTNQSVMMKVDILSPLTFFAFSRGSRVLPFVTNGDICLVYFIKSNYKGKIYPM